MRIASIPPMPPEASGIADYSGTAPPGSARARRRHRPEARRQAASRCRSLRLPHGNNPDAHGWILDALRRSPGLVVLHDFVLHHLVAGPSGVATGTGTSTRWSASTAWSGGCSRTACSTSGCPALGARPEDFPLAGEVLSLATGLVVHSRYVEELARAAGFVGPIARVAHPAWPVQVRPRSRRPAADRRLRNVNASSGCRSCSRRSPACAPSTPAPGSCSSGRPPRVRPRPPAAAPRARRGGIVREGFVDERRLWTLMAACDLHVNLRSPTMGETSGTAIRRSRWASRSSSRTSAGSRSCRRASRSRSGSETARWTSSQPPCASWSSAPTCGGDGSRGAHLAAGDTTSRVAERQAAAFERVAGGRAVFGAARRERGSRGGRDRGHARGHGDRGRLSEVDLGG